MFDLIVLQRLVNRCALFILFPSFLPYGWKKFCVRDIIRVIFVIFAVCEWKGTFHYMAWTSRARHRHLHSNTMLCWHYSFISKVTYFYKCFTFIWPKFDYVIHQFEFVKCCRIIPKAVGTLWQMKQMHATSGLILYTLVSASLVLGMFSTWFTKNVTGTSWYMCIACPMILVLVAMQQITSHYLPKRRTVSDKKEGK